MRGALGQLWEERKNDARVLDGGQLLAVRLGHDGWTDASLDELFGTGRLTGRWFIGDGLPDASREDEPAQLGEIDTAGAQGESEPLFDELDVGQDGGG